MYALEEVVAVQHAGFLCHYSLLLAQFEQAFLLAFQHHACLVVSAEPLLLGLQAFQTLLQPLQLRLGQSFGIFDTLQLRTVQDASIPLLSRNLAL